MRISTGMIFNSGVTSMQERTSLLLRTQQQISSGRRILTPSDDPVAAARSLEVTQSQSINKQFQTSQENAKSALGIMDSQLSSMTDLLVRVRERTVQAGNAALSTSDRKSIATEIRARFDELVGLANSTDGRGQYLFSGYQGATKPFAGSVDNGVDYFGDEGIRTLQVAGARHLPVSNSGNDIFMRIKNGNGVFATGIQSAKSVNASHITFEGTASVTNPPATTGSFEMRFWTDTAGTVKTSAQAVGTTVNLNTAFVYPKTFTDVVDSQMTITVDGVAKPVDLDPAGTGTAYADANAIVAAIQSAVGSSSATVSLSVTGRLVVTSATSGAPGSTLAFADAGVGASLTTTLFGGAPTVVNGANGAAGTTYFDLVDPATDMSLYTNAASTTGGAGNTYTHAYASGTPLNLASAGPFAFDYGATAVFTGAPADGDTFDMTRTASSLNVSGKTFNADAARATIDAGTVTSAVKWSQTANSDDFEVRFWVDAQGTVATSGQAVGTGVIPPGLVINAANNEFNIDINGGGAVPVTVASATYLTPALLAAAVQAGVNAALVAAPPAAGSATVSLDSSNRLVISLTDTGAASNLTVTAVGGDAGFTSLFGGAVTTTAGLAASAGRTFYDLVDATTGDSLFTGGTSTTGGAGNTFTRAYSSGSPISLSSAGGGVALDPAFDYGASVTVTGIPAGGDAFTIKSSSDAALGNGYFITAAKTASAANMGSGIVGSGEVRDQAKWDSPYNSRQLEVRFWKDPDDTRQDAPTYYDLVDATTEKSLLTGTTSTAGSGGTYTHIFKSGDAIPFSGLAVPYGDFGVTVTINGTPTSGDVFTLNSSTSRSIFETLGDLIHAVESPVGPPGSNTNAELHNKLGTALTGIVAAADNFSRVRADIGTRLGEIDDLGSVSSNFDLQYASTLSNLQDIDYSKAITDLMRIQMELQAAQQSFTKVSQLSLFNYL